MLDDAAKLQKKVSVCAAQVKRFGVDPVLVKRYNPLYKEEMEAPSDDYWKWYHWWKEYITSLSDQQFRELDRALEANQDVSTWRPKGDWRAR